MISWGNADRPKSLGLVSNCWNVQLDAGVGLEALVAEAVQRGLSAIELRQGSLGQFEVDELKVPHVERLAELACSFPNVQFNLALSLPCLSGDSLRGDSLFLAGRAAAVSMANKQPPHLRLVDLRTRADQCSESSIDRAARGLVALTEAIAEVEGTLSIEHSRQPWSWFSAAMERARSYLAERASYLKLCFDPCNLLLTERADDIASIVESVNPEEVSMIHIKQRRHGEVQPDVANGDLDWPRLLSSLQQSGHAAPLLFEIAPDVDVWGNLQSSIARLFGPVKHGTEACCET